MKNQALFSLKDKSEKLNVVCCNFCLALSGLMKDFSLTRAECVPIHTYCLCTNVSKVVVIVAIVLGVN